MAVKIDNVIAHRIGMRRPATNPAAAPEAWIYRQNIFSSPSPGVFTKISMKSDVANYATDFDPTHLGNPYKDDLSQWWGGFLSNTSTPGIPGAWFWHSATLKNPAAPINGVTRVEINQGNRTGPVEIAVEVMQAGNTQWTRIVTTIINGIAAAGPTLVYDLNEGFRMTFQHKGEPLVGTFQGFTRSPSGDQSGINAASDDGGVVIIPSTELGTLIYGTFIPNRPDLLPKIIGPIKST